MNLNTQAAKILTADHLSNEEYHAHPYVSGSTLARIHETCPAKWRYEDRKETDAMRFGTHLHTAVLEPSRFDSEFYRGIDKADYPDALASDAAMKSRLKELGIAGYSNKKTLDLIQMLNTADPGTQILSQIEVDHSVENDGKQEIKPADYDKVMQMRRVIMADEDYAKALSGCTTELSIIVPLDDADHDYQGAKVRFDCVTTDAGIWDLKSCASCHPEDFSQASFKHGYWLKMAFQHDVFEAVYGHPPSEVVLLAQEKSDPYIAQAYRLTDNQLAIGRVQYQQALNLYFRCMETDCWPAYGGGMSEMNTPAWVERIYQEVAQ